MLKVDKNDIIEHLWKSPFINDVIKTITSGHQLADDLKSELFLILCEMPAKKIEAAWNNNWINYLCINILKKQYHSNTSPFHNKFRRPNSITDVEVDTPIVEEDDNRDIIAKIEWIIENKLDVVDRELFKLYYKMDRYDRWLGDLRDTTCTKPTSSYRKIEKKLALNGHGKRVTISRAAIGLSHERAIMIIQNELKRYGDDI